MLRKNYLLQTRASKSWYSFGAAGWASLAIEIAVPAVFFALMCIPKHFLDPVHFPQQLSVPHDLDNPYWAFTYEGKPIFAPTPYPHHFFLVPHLPATFCSMLSQLSTLIADSTPFLNLPSPFPLHPFSSLQRQ